jgi:hypothetical protein
MDDNELLDHGDGPILGDEPPLTDEEAELLPLFADALDPDTPTTVDEMERKWREIFGA